MTVANQFAHPDQWVPANPPCPDCRERDCPNADEGKCPDCRPCIGCEEGRVPLNQGSDYCKACILEDLGLDADGPEWELED